MLNVLIFFFFLTQTIVSFTTSVLGGEASVSQKCDNCSCVLPTSITFILFSSKFTKNTGWKKFPSCCLEGALAFDWKLFHHEKYINLFENCIIPASRCLNGLLI